MQGKFSWAIFWAQVVVFVALVVIFPVSAFRESLGFGFIAALGGVFFLLGVALIVLTVKEKVGGKLKKFLLLTGASSAGVLVSALLHNAVYGLFIHFFGADFWDRVGMGDEPFFFILAIVICPLGFLVGVVGSIVLFVQGKRA